MPESVLVVGLSRCRPALSVPGRRRLHQRTNQCAGPKALSHLVGGRPCLERSRRSHHLQGLSATLLFRMSVRWGHRLVLAGAALLYLCYPLMNAVARGPLMYYAAHLVGGGVWGVLNAALLNRLMEREIGRAHV